MIQILLTSMPKTNKKKFVVQFFISVIAIVIIFSCYFFYRLELIKKENLSKYIAKNYELSKLYSNNYINSSNKSSDIIGTISIPKLNLSYAFFSGISDDLLKIAPCRFSGEMPNVKSNLCIAAHNYNDKRFFGQIFSLNIDDEIIIQDTYGNIFLYYVYDKYEVDETDISPINYNYKNVYELTLITCNNFNNNRIIVKAKTESL